MKQRENVAAAYVTGNATLLDAIVPTRPTAGAHRT
jgi:hypothetical protein